MKPELYIVIIVAIVAILPLGILFVTTTEQSYTKAKTNVVGNAVSAQQLQQSNFNLMALKDCTSLISSRLDGQTKEELQAQLLAATVDEEVLNCVDSASNGQVSSLSVTSSTQIVQSQENQPQQEPAQSSGFFSFSSYGFQYRSPDTPPESQLLNPDLQYTSVDVTSNTLNNVFSDSQIELEENTLQSVGLQIPSSWSTSQSSWQETDSSYGVSSEPDRNYDQLEGTVGKVSIGLSSRGLKMERDIGGIKVATYFDVEADTPLGSVGILGTAAQAPQYGARAEQVVRSANDFIR